MNNYIVYLLICSDDTFYCGITNDILKRLRSHNSGKASKYTRGRLPVFLVCWSRSMSKSEALKLEYKVKQIRSDRKIDFLNKHSGVI